ncbi:MAG: high-potential iron-sulfur protein [Caulobacteraceae bacterium]|nr:high-potential iron-sulfur protein [Caulobacteraceae bacterium]
MSSQSQPTTRRTVLMGAALLTGLAGLARSGPAAAQGTTPQASAKYQPTPKGANKCSKCNFFVPGPNATALGQCKVVAGKVSPNGWCLLFAPKA